MRLTRLKLFFLFLFFGAIITIISAGIQFFFLKSEIKKEFRKDSHAIISTKTKEFTAIKQQAVDTVLSLSYSHFLSEYLQQPTMQSKKHVEKSFFDSMAVMPNIMQLRYLDNAGNEIVKLNRDKPYGPIEQLPAEHLENKQGRYYYNAIKSLEPGSVYISDFDLNIEHGEVELPLKPTLRAGTQVMEGETPQGMVIINLFMDGYIQSLKDVKLVTLYLADSEGYFLIHADKTKSWSRFFDKNSTVNSEFNAESAKRILAENSYRYEDLYSVTIPPIANERALKLISKMNHSVLNLEEKTLTKNILLEALIIALFAFVLSGLFGRYISRLNEQLMLHSELLDTAGDGIIVHDMEGKLIYVNETACHERGYTKEEMLQIPIPELDAPEYKENIHKVVQDLETYGHTEFRVEHLRKDGSRLPLDVRTKVIHIDDKPIVISAARDISAQLVIEKKLQESEERYRLLVETAVSGIFQTSIHGDLLFANPAMKKILGYHKDDAFEHLNIGHFYKHLSKRRELLHELRQHKSVQNYEIDIISKNGDEKIILLNVSLVGKSITGMFIDITEIKKAQEQIKVLSQVVTQIDDSVALTDIDGTIHYVNDAFAKHTGFSEEELIGKTQRLLKSGHHPQEFYKLLWDTILAGNSFRATFINKKKGDGIFYEEKTITPLKNKEGEITGFVSTAKDITDRVKMEEALRESAQTDHLTGLYNRLKFEDSIARELEMKRRYGQRFSLILFDIDHFKEVNDTYGHDIGDQVLKQLAQLLNERMRKTDIIARWGGEEFIVLLPETTLDTALMLAEKIRTAVADFPFEAVEQVTISLGVTEFLDDDSEQKIIKRVDDALYKAKELGRNRVISA